MKKSSVGDGFISPQDLAKRTDVTIHQINDYTRRHLLRVTKYSKRTRCLAEPPSSAIVRFIQRHVEENGNLRGCDELLVSKYPDYYKQS